MVEMVEKLRAGENECVVAQLDHSREENGDGVAPENRRKVEDWTRNTVQL